MCTVILACGGCILEFVLEKFFCGKNLSYFGDLNGVVVYGMLAKIMTCTNFNMRIGYKK